MPRAGGWPVSPSSLGETQAEVVNFDSEPILGWRAWRIRLVDGDPDSLRSATYPLRWPVRKPMRAHCLQAWMRRGHSAQPRLPEWHRSAPVLDHTCGIYATRTAQQARSWSSPTLGNLPNDRRIIGRVALWGRVLQHTGGWRAEFAYPYEFVLPVALPDIDVELVAAWLETRYAVPVRIGGEEWELDKAA